MAIAPKNNKSLLSFNGISDAVIGAMDKITVTPADSEEAIFAAEAAARAAAQKEIRRLSL